MQATHDENDTSDNVTSTAVESPTLEAPSKSSMTINDFLFSLNIDNINFVKLINYVKESNIIHKVSKCRSIFLNMILHLASCRLAYF